MKIALGQLITDNPRRDAVHVAVAPMRALEVLKPGQRVTHAYDDYVNRAGRSRGIGIVDPFLFQDVQRGERFWVFMDPETVTNTRHAWTHPDLPSEDSEDGDSDSWCKESGC